MHCESFEHVLDYIVYEVPLCNWGSVVEQGHPSIGGSAVRSPAPLAHIYVLPKDVSLGKTLNPKLLPSAVTAVYE